MKKFLIATGISIVVLTGCAYSQEPSNSLLALKSSRQKSQFVNDINIRAMRDFVSRYANVNNELWHKNNGCDVAVFFLDSIQYRVVYDIRGDLNYIMKYYEESKMARDVRGQIKSVYYDYKIFIVQEIDSPDNPPIYIVNLQGDADWKKVRLCQGEIVVLEEYRKGK